MRSSVRPTTPETVGEWLRAMFAAEMPPPRKLVLFGMAMYMDRDGSSCYPSMRTLAARTGLGERTVRNHLHAAARDGWIDIHRRRGRGERSGWISYEYVPTIPAPVPAPDAATPEAVPAPDAATPTQVPAPDARVPAADDTSTGRSCRLPDPLPDPLPEVEGGARMHARTPSTDWRDRLVAAALADDDRDHDP